MKLTSKAKNLALLQYIVLPFAMLTVVLLGGLRISAENHQFVFVPPSLITLVLAILILSLAIRSGLLRIDQWLSTDQPTLSLISNFLTLISVYFASAQALNSVLPEGGFLHWMFSLFFLWTLWNDQFTVLDARRTIRSLGVLFVTAFFLKHVLFASISASEGSWLSQLAAGLIQSVVVANLSGPAYAAATGYISFFTIGLFICGLILLPSAPSEAESNSEAMIVRGESDDGIETTR